MHYCYPPPLPPQFRFMVRDNERIEARTRGLEGEVEAPPILIMRQSSFGRRAMAAATAPTHSKWQEGINELSRMPGGRMLPLLKLALLENLQLSGGSAAAAGAAGAPTAATTVASAAPAAGDASAGTASTVASGGSYNGIVHSAASTGARVTAAPASPATPALAGRLREPPPPPSRQQRAAAPDPPAAAIIRQQQQQQAPPAATLNLDDLLGLTDEPLPQASRAPAVTHLKLSALASLLLLKHSPHVQLDSPAPAAACVGAGQAPQAHPKHTPPAASC